MKNKMKHLRNERGAVLITMLMFLVVLTVIGLTSISITSLENKTAKNERIYEERMNNEEGGIEPQVKVLEETLSLSAIPVVYTDPGGPVVAGTNLQNEIMFELIEADSVDLIGPSGPDLQIMLGTTVVNMDIDYLYTSAKAGSAIEFAAGSEGTGSGGGGGMERKYQLISEATVGNGSGFITNHYDCVVTSGGCQK